MSSLEEENENAVWIIYQKKQLYSENEKAFLLTDFNLIYGTDLLL